jgi:hypothetical protein
MIMIEAGIIRRIGAALVMLLMISGLSWAVDMHPGKYALEHTNDFQQDVSGEGYAMVYQDINTNNLTLKNYMHGSGTMDMATLISSLQKSLTKIELDTTGGIIYDYKANEDSKITFTEQNEMSYAPESFAYGTGWYAVHPVNYNSLLKEKTDAKSYQSGISMEHQIEYARAFKKDVGVVLNCAGGDVGIKGIGLGQMRIEEDVTQGTVHIGELLTKPLYPTTKIKASDQEPLIVVDENYVGNFKITKNMTINVPKAKLSWNDDWLPCCSGGFFDLQDQKVRTTQTGIFDCTCRETALKNYKPAWNGTVAQFPTVQYQKKP